MKCRLSGGLISAAGLAYSGAGHKIGPGRPGAGNTR